ncbi:hypothetical protein AcV5_000581 [Taiwanofungus camphoratus]|nr:hypothetical protein AcW2_006785 [Antrodia cinnamomea]KAI0939061.1 hypothetical protein AcV5_000581 [Antrodia cinnamomea]KAI0951978.1 hypothetical protein AcV7_007921 [Antrodia cinnamomea]
MLQATLPRLPFRRIIATHALRTNLASLHASLPQRNLCRADFSTTSRRCASEEPNAQALLGTQQKLVQMMQEKPELMQQVMDLKGMLDKEGVDVQGKSMPSKLEIFRVLMKPTVREAVMKLSTSFQEAGINPKEMMEELMAMERKK